MRPRLLIGLKSIRNPGLSISRDEGLIVGAMTSLTALNRSEDAKQYAVLLSEAAGHAASQEIRNMGTLGGNLCQERRCLYYNRSHLFQFQSPCFKRGGEPCYSIPGGMPTIHNTAASEHIDVITEQYKRDGPYRTKEVGEGYVSAILAAIANAVYDATGVRLYSTPFTPQKILRGPGKIT